jgi:hypothetical protein
VCELAASESASIPCAERNWPNDSASDPYAALLVSDLKGAGGKPTSWIWDGYLAAEEITLLTSLWKSGKTTLISILLARLKDGGMLGGHRVTPGRVVMVTEEGPSMWFERSQLLPFDNHVCWFCRPFTGKPRPEEWLALLDQIGRLHDRQKIDLLVLDSLANLSPMLTENDAGEMLKALLPLQRRQGGGWRCWSRTIRAKGRWRRGRRRGAAAPYRASSTSLSRCNASRTGMPKTGGDICGATRATSRRRANG